RSKLRGMLRRKGTGARTWLVLDRKGERNLVEVRKQVIMQQTGVSARDLRILDPLLSYPSTIVGRDRAMLINLEHIYAIITAQQVLLLDSTHSSVVPFVEDLHQRILTHHSATQPQPLEDGDETKQDGMKVLPFEFVTLEACLEAACSALENEAHILEQETYPALDKLTSQISTLNLERIRLVKSRLVALTARVRRVKDELEHLLDDDEDMAELYLTEKIPPEISLGRGGDSASNHEDDQYAADYSREQMLGASNRVGSEIQADTTHISVTKHSFDVEELEMLLGAYFVQIGGTLNKLARVREYVDDTEDYINIALDEKQNRLLQMGMKLSTASMLLNAFIGVTATLSINIHIGLFDTGTPQFLGTIIGGTLACIFFYVLAIIWYKHKGLVD
ncbi:Magnesium transporter MRS2-3, partial [Mucuna pruriens]